MGTPAPPDRLEKARRDFGRRERLRASLLSRPASAWPGTGAVVAFVLALTVVLAGEAVVPSGPPFSALAAVAVGLLPLVAAAVTAAVMLGRWAASRLLAAGGEPEAVAVSLAALAACGALVLAGLAVGDPRREAPGWVAVVAVFAVVLVFATFSLSRRALRRRLGLGPAPEGGTPVQRLSRRRVRRWAMAAGAVVLATAAISVGMMARARGGSTPMPASRLVLPPPSGRVAVVALDGLAREDLEALPRLLPDAGWDTLRAWAWAELEVGREKLPAVRWTTVACGASAARHGVEMMEELRLFGQPSGVELAAPLRLATLALWQPLGAAEVVARPTLDRRLPTFWEMASRAGCPVTVGGWWASWPVRRVLGEVASERAWLGGAWGRDAATPSLAPLVREAWSRAGNAADASDFLARRLAQRAAGTTGTHLVALALPSIDLEERASPPLPILARADALRPHLEALQDVIATLRQADYTVWLVGMPWRGGTPFVATSGGGGGGRFAPVPAVALADTWLAQLGLPPGRGGPEPRVDLLGTRIVSRSEVDYGAPPPPLGLPSSGGTALQREVLRSLGYLR